MQFNQECSKCGSKKVVPNVNITTAEPRKVKAEVLKAPGSWLYNKPVRKDILANVCANCGHMDFYMSKEDARNLWEAYLESKNN